jgi:phosphoribosylamine--glycine ligase
MSAGMHVLVVGGGAREHALCWKLRQSPLLERLYCLPGNPGTANLATNLPGIDGTEIAATVEEAWALGVDLVVVGPEAPLAAGLADALRERGIVVYGPSKAAAQIEASKVWAKQLMRRAGIPTGRAEAFADAEAAHAYARGLGVPPVVKADGLAAGKGVVVPQTLEDALAAIDAALVEGVFGASGSRVLLEERLSGREVSFHAFCDGTLAVPMVTACDYKRVGDGDQGPNTGGMGAYSPAGFVSPALADEVQRTITQAAVTALAAEGHPYRGTLYPGLMITDAGPRVIEFNCRFGDPETEVILPRLRSDLLPILYAAATGSLAGIEVEWDDRPCVAIVLTSGGYPGTYRTGIPIDGLDALPDDVIVFHAGTRFENGRVVTAGGRVLTVAALGETIDDARSRAYEAVRRISFDGMQYRSDIALHV